MNSMGKAYRRALITVLSLVMALSGCIPAVYAEGQDESKEKDRPAAGIHAIRKGATLNEVISAFGTEDKKDEEADGVVVMFNDDEEITVKKAKEALSSGTGAVKDIQVEEVWNFEDDQEGSGLGLQSEEDDLGAGIALVTSDSMDADKLAERLEKRPDVKYAEKNSRVHALSVTNDTYSDLQWSMQSDENTPNVAHVWNNSGVTGSEKVVAIVDTGINYKHPDLKDNLWVNSQENRRQGLKGKYGYDFINGDDDPMDDNGHGSHCAGIIGAVGNNEMGISGVNQKIKIMALKILDYEGSAYLAHEIAAYNYISKAIDLGVPVVAVNNSWGGGEESDIMRELIDIVGEKGAVTVCAAGNESNNNDEYPGYPCDLDSPYIISVAATREDGNLASFSNFGDSVDVAAPGADILSTVSNDSYNPTLYGDINEEGSDQQKISAKYNSFEAPDMTDLMPDSFYNNDVEFTKNGDTFEGENGQQITVEMADDGFHYEGSHAMKITYKGLKEGDFICAPLSYTIADGFDPENNISPTLSLMVKAKGPEDAVSFFGGPIFGLLEGSKDTPLTTDKIGNAELIGTYVDGESDTWNHFERGSYRETIDAPAPGDERQFIIMMYAAVAGDYEVLIDDIGMSRQDLKDTSVFGQYDFYSGTSMATPYITGTVALKRAEKEAAGQKVDAEDLINEILAMTKDDTAPELPIGPKRSLDFRNVPEKLPPRIMKVSADVSASTDPGRVVVTGSGFDPSGGDLSIKVIKDGVEKLANGISGDLKEISFDDQGWINNIVDVEITANGKTAAKRNIYLVNGKKTYTKVKDAEPMINNEAVTTDGNYIYNAANSMKCIGRTSVKNLSESDDTFAEIRPEEIFETIEKDPKKKYGLLFGNDLVYMNGYLYTIVEYGAADEKEVEDDDDWFFSTGNGAKDEDEEDGEYDGDGNEDEELTNFSIYDGEYRLVRANASTGKVATLGEPDNLIADRQDYTMAAYNGKLYFIGGYTVSDVPGEDDKIPSKAVTIYDPTTGNWSEGPELPEGRYGGKAIQTGSYLVYTLGNGDPAADMEDGDFPANLIFDGKSWKVSAAPKLRALGGGYAPDVSIVKGGILYTGIPVYDYGDTFTYNVADDKFADTGYNFIKNLDDVEPRSIAVGGTVYASCDDGVFKMQVQNGFIPVKATVKGKGKVIGAGNVAPGNDAVLTVKANKHNHIKSIKVNGKAVKVKANAVKQVVTIKKPAKAQTVAVVFAKDRQVKVTVKKSGKGKVSVAKKYYVGDKVKITVKAAKKYYVKSFKVGSKNVKLKKKASKASYTIKKIKKNTKVVVKFAKK